MVPPVGVKRIAFDEQVAEHLLQSPRVTADDGGGIDDAVEVDALALHLRPYRLARLVERVLDAHRPRLDAEARR